MYTFNRQRSIKLLYSSKAIKTCGLHFMDLKWFDEVLYPDDSVMEKSRCFCSFVHYGALLKKGKQSDRVVNSTISESTYWWRVTLQKGVMAVECPSCPHSLSDLTVAKISPSPAGLCTFTSSLLCQSVLASLYKVYKRS